MLRHLLDLFEAIRDLFVGQALNIFRVIADRRIHKRIVLSIGDRLAAGLRVTAGVQDELYVIFRHGREQRVAVLIEPRVVIVRVGIKYFHRFTASLSNTRSSSLMPPFPVNLLGTKPTNRQPLAA